MERLKRRHTLNIGSLLHQSLGAKYLSLFVPDFLFSCAPLVLCICSEKTQSTFFPPLQIPDRILIDIFSKRGPLINISCVCIRKHVYIALLFFSFVYQLQVDGLPLSCMFTTRSRAYSVSFPVILYIAYIYMPIQRKVCSFFPYHYGRCSLFSSLKRNGCCFCYYTAASTADALTPACTSGKFPTTPLCLGYPRRPPESINTLYIQHTGAHTQRRGMLLIRQRFPSRTIRQKKSWENLLLQEIL